MLSKIKYLLFQSKDEKPEFASFVDAVIEEKLHRRIHLRPYATRCDYCNNRYDFVGHYEDGIYYLAG